MTEVAGVPTEIWEMIGAYSELPERLRLSSTNQRMAELREQGNLWPEIPTTASDLPTRNPIRQAYWIHNQDLGCVREVGQLGSQWCDLRPVSAQGYRYLVYRKQFEPTLCLWNLDTNQTLSQQLNFSPTMLRVLSVAPLRIGIDGAATSASGARYCHIFDAQLNSLGSIPLAYIHDPLWPCPVSEEGLLYQRSAGTAHPIEWRIEDGAYRSHQLTQAPHPGTCSNDTVRLGNQSYFINQQGELTKHGAQAPFTPTWTLPQTVHYGGPQQISGIRFGEGWLILLCSLPYGEGTQDYDVYRVWLRDDGTSEVLSTHRTPWRPVGLSFQGDCFIETYVEHQGLIGFRIHEASAFPHSSHRPPSNGSQPQLTPPRDVSQPQIPDQSQRPDATTHPSPQPNQHYSFVQKAQIVGKWTVFASAIVSARLTWRLCPNPQLLFATASVFVIGVTAATSQQHSSTIVAAGLLLGPAMLGGTRYRHAIPSTLLLTTWTASYCFAIDYYNRPSPIELSDAFSPTPQEPDTP